MARAIIGNCKLGISLQASTSISSPCGQGFVMGRRVFWELYNSGLAIIGVLVNLGCS